MAKRAEIMRRRRVKDDYIASWFSYEPVSRPGARSPRRATLAKTRDGRATARTVQCASPFSARAAFRRTTADLKPSPKNFPLG